ncbi:MAG: DapH/DapD/GlmU-related protein [Chloroflexota bacterium]
MARIVEAADATDAELAIREVNAGIYAFERAWLADALPAIAPSPVTGELYLPLLVAAAVAAGRGAIALGGPDDGTLAGINDRAELARAEALLRDRIVLGHQRAGVTIVDPATTWIDAEVRIAEDVTIEPDVRLRGATTIGRDTRIGSGSEIVASRIGERTTILRSVVEDAEVGDGVRVGPWAHLRAGARIGDGAEIGNYAEVKASRIGAGTKQHHFSYLGDAQIGAGVNIGAGTITANYDGRRKHPTEIGDGAFIGSDTVLRAPVRVGRDAITGAGSVVTHDVPDGAVVAGVPTRPRERRADPAAEAER